MNRQLGIRRSYIHESRRVALEFIERNLQTLVFANNRLATEVLVTYLKDACDRGPAGGETVRGYRGGYLPRERRDIERRLREGEIRAVVATNALELGIDIGSLDAVVMAGYPGTIASSWQRAGRAGRRQGTSAAVLVASSAPLDQYIVEHPDYFFGRSPEHAYINPENLEILLAHIKCAAFELPIREGEKFGRHDIGEVCRFLEEAGFLHHSAGAWHWTSDTYPADATSLRSVASDNFVVVDTTGEPQVIAEVSFPTALTTLHEKAIYLHEARQYQVERFDYAERKAYVKRVESDYYTDAIDYTQVKVLQEFEGEALAGARRAHGDVRVNRQIVGFKKIKFYTSENVGAGKLSMPEQEMHTTAFWLHFPAEFLARFSQYTPAEKQSGIAGLGNALRTVAALLRDVRSAGPGGGAERRHLRRPGDLRAQPVSLRYVSRRRGTKRAALPPGAAAAEADGGAAGGVRVRGRLPVVRGAGGRSGGAGEGSSGADARGVDCISVTGYATPKPRSSHRFAFGGCVACHRNRFTALSTARAARRSLRAAGRAR